MCGVENDVCVSCMQGCVYVLSTISGGCIFMWQFSGMSALDVHVIVDVVCAHVAVLLWVMCVHVCISIPAGDISNGEAVRPHIVCGFWVLYQ